MCVCERQGVCVRARVYVCEHVCVCESVCVCVDAISRRLLSDSKLQHWARPCSENQASPHCTIECVCVCVCFGCVCLHVIVSVHSAVIFK